MFLSKQKEITLYSNLSLEECKQRLLENIDPSDFIHRLPRIDKRVIGEFSGNTLYIGKNSYFGREGIQLSLKVKILASGANAIITCSPNDDSKESVLGGIVPGFILVFFVFLSIYPTIKIFPLFGIFLFIVLLYAYGYHYSQKEISYLIEFIKTTLNASEQSASS